jgi:hypothetical protein
VGYTKGYRQKDMHPDQIMRRFLISAYYTIPKDISQFDEVSKRIYDLSVKVLYLKPKPKLVHDLGIE